VRAAVRIEALRTRLRGVACITVLLSACHQQPTTAPSWPVEMQLLLVNTTTDAVFVRAEGDESLYPGIAHLPPNDSACTTVSGFADSVPVEVHSFANPNILYGSGWLYPLRSLGWHAVVSTGGVVVARSTGCS